ncbi:hypothetical protein SLEP1_g44703 [Rubroshorea leprosula]|uniref:Uncharacterized protein n=1 Tax=Rubroshorea leprosula TaxID=152421 RepID=A0AAV5LH05_9ROSI|nr:hypothetical protein SLEP1_g44703 [Rubroshorea leprosula]
MIERGKGEKYSSHCLLRAVKNRFGSIDELGIFEMSQLALQAVSSPSEMFLSGDQHSNSEFLAGLAVAVTVIMDASCAFLIEIQALVPFLCSLNAHWHYVSLAQLLQGMYMGSKQPELT